MKVNHISSTNFQSAVRIQTVENKGRQYLYNEVEAIRKEFKIPATFRTHEIELPSVSKAVLIKLKELGIKFSNK